MKALLLQGVALLSVVVVLIGFKELAGAHFPLLPVLVLQGTFAAGLAFAARLDFWWLPIQFFFPLALAGMLAVSLPPLVYLLLFIAFLGLYWSTFRTRVPYFPSHLEVWESVAQLLPANGKLQVIDIGSGFGGLVMYLADYRPGSTFTGIEIAPLPWLMSKLRARLEYSRARFIRGDYERLDFADYDVVFAYLSPAAMPGLWAKAKRQMRPGTLLLSYEFPIPGITPEITTEPDGRNATIYGWYL